MTTSAAIEQFATRLEALNYRRFSGDESELPFPSSENFFIVKNPGGGGLDAEYGTLKFDFTEEINVVIYRAMADDYVADVKALADAREAVKGDLIQKESWASTTSGIVINQYDGHTVEEITEGAYFRDEIRFRTRIRKSF